MIETLMDLSKLFCMDKLKKKKTHEESSSEDSFLALDQ